MTGPERVARSTARYDPITHIMLEPCLVPAFVKSTKSKSKTPQPPRPQNAWILYRAWALSSLLERQPELKGTPQSQLSKILGQQWANETPEIRRHFEHQANINKERHAQKFPDYVFKPQKKEDKERERELKKEEKARDRETRKFRKEIERSMRCGYLPPTMMDRPTVEVLEKLAHIKFDDLGPSPPISQCPSPEMSSPSIDDEPFITELPPLSDASPPDSKLLPEGDVVANTSSAPSASETPSDVYSSNALPHSIPLRPSTPTPSQPDNSMVFDASAPVKPSSDICLDWSKVASGGMSGIDEFINQAFPPGMPGPVSDRFEMPSGNIVVTPGFIDNAMQSNEFDASGIVSIPLDSTAGMLDDQYNCDLANPHAEQDLSPNAYDSFGLAQYGNEAVFMQPFVQLDVSLDHLLSVGKEVGDVLLDEREACANGERIIAAEHMQNGAPATSVVKPGVSSFLPSPPESSSSAISPLAPMLFDFGDATNLSASGSNQNQQPFDGMAFSDTMSASDMGSSAWNYPAFGDFAPQFSFGFGSSNDASSNSAQLSTNTGVCGSGLQAGTFSSVPPTPVSAGPRLDGSFEIDEIAMADFSSSSLTSSSADDAGAQKENAWFASYFNEPGPV